MDIIQRINQRIALNEQLQQFIHFGIIGTAGAVLNTFILYVLTLYTPLHYLVAAAIATQLAIVSNFIGNHTATFKTYKNGKSLTKKFLTFQAVSLFGLVLTLTTLWTLTTLFGIKYLLVWNLIAILITFVANFLLNKYFTWGTTNLAPKTRSVKSLVTKLTIVCLAVFALAATVHAETVAVSQLGYHPSSAKQVVVYTSEPSGTFSVGTVSGTLARPFDASGNPTNCQGNNPCLVGDFSSLTTPGTYTVTTSFGASPSFTISPGVYSTVANTLTQYFEAEKMQGSAFHPDMNTQQQPPLPAIADGSFIMTADQAALSLIRLGSAYRRNPAIGGKAQSTISTYVGYLQGLQGAQAQVGSGTTRLSFGTYAITAFTPGAVTTPTIDVYNAQGTKISTLPVTSLCNADQACIDKAINHYKCQVGEVCLSLTYNDNTGTIVNNGGMAVARGWIYDWSCYIDSSSATFTNRNNPCLIFDASTDDPDSGESYVSKVFLAYLEAIPALSSSQQQSVYERAVATYNYMKSNPSTFDSPSEKAYYGAGLFLLYDYTNDPKYLQEAHSLSGGVEQNLVSDHTRGSEFYWEEYARHKAAMTVAGLTPVNAEDKFIGKMFHDWNGRGFESIASNGERVYQFDNNVQFSNSRFILTEGLQAAKTIELDSNPQDFMKVIADNQLAWMTGMNGVQAGVAQGSPIRSYSFIFGIGQHPAEMHTRFLVDTGHAGAGLAGAHGIEYKWKDQSGNMIWFDGKTNLLGVEFGALGNAYNGEAQIEPFTPGATFSNGMTYIPGWINGAYDTKFNENDVIFNYVDDMKDFTYTESTNEIVATAIEYAAYLDAQKNGVARAPVPQFGDIQPPTGNATLTISSTPPLADVIVDGTAPRVTPAVYSLAPGSHQVYVAKEGYIPYENTVTLIAGENRILPVTLVANGTTNTTETASLDLTTSPGGAFLFIDNIYSGTTNSGGALTVDNIEVGNHTIHITKTGYTDYLQNMTFVQGSNTLSVTLAPTTVNSTNASNVTIVSGTTSLPPRAGQAYYMLENNTATFGVTTASSGTVVWTLEYTQHPDDGGQVVSQVLASTSGTTHSITFEPTVLITSKIVTARITASTASSSKSWIVDIEDVVNPFWSGDFGAAQAILHVYTHDTIIGKARNVTVTLQGKGGASTASLAAGFNNSRETDWQQTLQLNEGTTYVTQITVTNNQGAVHVFSVPAVVGHYRTETTTSSSGERRSERRRSGGSSGAFANRAPEVVYALFEKDIVGIDERQTLRLDATDDLRIERVVATILGPEGYRTEELSLVGGEAGYGTWEVTFQDFTAGQYMLEAVTLWDQMPNPTEHNITASFYVVSDAVAAHETLGLVYSVMDKNRIQANQTVTLTLDARDVYGIEEVRAFGVTNRNGTNFTFPLELVAGNPQYGTWRGNFTPSEPDTTYTITTVALSNGNETKNYTLKDRSVYVAAIPGRASARGEAEVPFFSVENMRNLLKKPLIPTLIGFTVMLIIIALVTVNSGLRDKFRRKSRH